MTTFWFFLTAAFAILLGTLAARLFMETMHEEPPWVICGAAFTALSGAASVVFGFLAAQLAALAWSV